MRFIGFPGFQKVAPFTLGVQFDDGTSQTIDFRPVLEGELYGPLQEPTLFDQVRIDPEVHTLVWPNGADFDPAIIHNWPESGPALKALAEHGYLQGTGYWFRHITRRLTRFRVSGMALGVRPNAICKR